MRTARTALVVLILISLGRLFLAHGQLPDTVASHFDAAGRPDGWSSRDQFVSIFAFLILFMGGIFLAIGWMMQRLPDRFINLSNKDYWLAEERRRATLDDLDARLSWMGVATVLFMMAILELSIRANLHDAQSLPSPTFLALTLAYVVVVTLQTIYLMLRYSGRPPG